MKLLKNISHFFISNKRDSASGSVIFSGIAGMRPFLIEVQSLVCDSNFPQIETVGFDLKRTKMILAILQQWCGFFFGNKDVYVNIVGGMKITDSAVDLAVAMAIASSFKQRTISAEVCFFGELGLTGEIRRATSAELRVKESLRLGFKKVFANSDLKGVTEVNLISKLMDLL